MKFVQGSASKKGRVLLRPTEDQAADINARLLAKLSDDDDD